MNVPMNAEISCNARFATIIVVALGSILLNSVSAFGSDASPEQCTCNLPGFQKPTGAQVMNAGSCVLESRYPWCDIYIATMENSSEHTIVLSGLNSIANNGDSAQLRNLLLPMYDKYVDSVIPKRAAAVAEYKSDRITIEKSIYEEGKPIQECLKAFAVKEPISRGAKFVNCRVGNQSRWLQMEFKSGERRYLFLFSP